MICQHCGNPLPECAIANLYIYRLESKDLVNGRIKHQTFTGNVTMVKYNNNWIIQDQDGQLADSYYE